MARRASLSSGANPSPLQTTSRVHRHTHSMDDSLILDVFDDNFSSIGLEQDGSLGSGLNRTHPDGVGGATRRDAGRESFNAWKQKNAENHVPQLNNKKKKQMLKQQQRKSISQSHYGNGSSYAGSMSNYSMASSKSESEIDFDDDGTMITTDSGLRHSIQAATSKLNYFPPATNSGLLSPSVDEEDEEREDDLFFHADNEDDASIDIPMGDDEAPVERNKKAVLEKYMNAPRRPLSRHSPQNLSRSAHNRILSENGVDRASHEADEERRGDQSSSSKSNLEEGDKSTRRQSLNSSKDSLESYLPKSSAHGSTSSSPNNYEQIALIDTESVDENPCRQGRRRRRSSVSVSKQRGSFALERLRTFMKTEVERPNFKRNCVLSFTMLLFVGAGIAFGVYFGTSRSMSTASGEIQSMQPQSFTEDMRSNSTHKGEEEEIPIISQNDNATEDVDSGYINGTVLDTSDVEGVLNSTEKMFSVTDENLKEDDVSQMANDEGITNKTAIDDKEAAVSLVNDGAADLSVSTRNKKRWRTHEQRR